jgi:tRNA (mo5U34)-methyltransferase
MRNIRVLPTVDTLLDWVNAAGWHSPRHVDTTRTTCKEQRQTEWMTFHSLEQFLNPDDASLTVEGYPAPQRSVVLATAP